MVQQYWIWIITHASKIYGDMVQMDLLHTFLNAR
jgi:hypothetical protein